DAAVHSWSADAIVDTLFGETRHREQLARDRVPQDLADSFSAKLLLRQASIEHRAVRSDPGVVVALLIENLHPELAVRFAVGLAAREVDQLVRSGLEQLAK